MIRVTVELWPKGRQENKRALAQFSIDYAPGVAPAADAPEEYEIEAKEFEFKATPATTSHASFAHPRGAGILALVATALHAIGKRPTVLPPPAGKATS